MLGDRIRIAREARSLERRDLADAIGMPYSTLADIENNRQRSTTELHKLASALKVRVEWLADGKGPRDAPDDDDADWPDILAVRQAASLGDGVVPDDYAETHKLKFRADSLRRKGLRPALLAVVYGRGDSMLPRIRNGDAIMFDTADTSLVDGRLYVITHGGHLMAKRLTQLGGRWFVESLNRDDPKWRKPEPVDEHKGFTVHGRVRWIGSWED